MRRHPGSSRTTARWPTPMMKLRLLYLQYERNWILPIITGTMNQIPLLWASDENSALLIPWWETCRGSAKLCLDTYFRENSEAGKPLLYFYFNTISSKIPRLVHIQKTKILAWEVRGNDWNHQSATWQEVLWDYTQQETLRYKLSCVSPKFLCWGPSPHCNGIWRWGLEGD